MQLNKYKSFFLVGIGGAGMSAIAIVLKGMGYHVGGSDLKESRYTNILKKEGIEVFIGHNQKNIIGYDAIIISAAIKTDNVEYKSAIKSKIPVYNRSDILAWILNQKNGIAVAGTHGKTTTTSMISLILKDLSLNPTIIIGGELNELGTNASFGNGAFIVAEACESDGSFLKYKPFISVVTSIGEDHMDYYENFEDIRTSFINFLNNTKENGYVVVNGDELSNDMLEGLRAKNIIKYGLNNTNDIYAQDIKLNGFCTQFTLKFKNKQEYQHVVKLNIPGIHNLKNCLAAISVSYLLNLDLSQCINILEKFSGVKRRFEIRGKFKDALIVDDYAHHPTEIKATLDAASNLNSNKIITVFQPHRYTRLKALYGKFSRCFDKTDVLIITDIFGSGEEPIPGITSRLLVDYLIDNDFSKKIVYLPKLSDIEEYIEKIAKKEDLIIFMGAGDITRVSDSLIKINNN